jgi:hypothetical protein
LKHEKLLKPLLDKLIGVLGKNLSEAPALTEKIYPKEGLKSFGVLLKRKDEESRSNLKGVVSNWISDMLWREKIYPAQEGAIIDLDAAMVSDRQQLIKVAIVQGKFGPEGMSDGDLNALGLGVVGKDFFYYYYDNPEFIPGGIAIAGPENVLLNGRNLDLQASILGENLSANLRLHVLSFKNRPKDIFAVLSNISVPIPAIAATRVQSALPEAVQDRAMKGELNGGIDLTPAKINLQTREGGDDKEDIKFNIDRAMFRQLQNAPGFIPVIINIQPLKSLSVFLGLNQGLRLSAADTVSNMQ